MPRGEAVKLLRSLAETSLPRDCREPTCQTITTPDAATYPEDVDLGAIKSDLEFLIEQVTRFREEQARRRITRPALCGRQVGSTRTRLAAR